jgi:hypothetical protein
MVVLRVAVGAGTDHRGICVPWLHSVLASVEWSVTHEGCFGCTRVLWFWCVFVLCVGSRLSWYHCSNVAVVAAQRTCIMVFVKCGMVFL